MPALERARPCCVAIGENAGNSSSGISVALLSIISGRGAGNKMRSAIGPIKPARRPLQASGPANVSGVFLNVALNCRRVAPIRNKQASKVGGVLWRRITAGIR